MPTSPSPAKDRLLAAAARLFYAHGIANTGIDAIITAAGVAKKSLYNNFASKDELVREYIEARHAEWRGLFASRRLVAASPRDRILAVFDAYADHALAAYEHGFRGCGLLNAAAELPAGSAGRAAVALHKAEVERILRDELEELTDLQTAKDTAEHLSFLVEGAMARAGLDGTGDRVTRARSIAAHMIDDL